MTAATEALNVAEAAYKRDGHISGVSTGLRDLDKQLGGLQKSDLIIIAGAARHGKIGARAQYRVQCRAPKRMMPSASARPAEDGAVVAFFSLEMSAAQLAQRILSAESGVPADKRAARRYRSERI